MLNPLPFSKRSERARPLNTNGSCLLRETQQPIGYSASGGAPLRRTSMNSPKRLFGRFQIVAPHQCAEIGRYRPRCLAAWGARPPLAGRPSHGSVRRWRLLPQLQSPSIRSGQSRTFFVQCSTSRQAYLPLLPLPSELRRLDPVRVRAPRWICHFPKLHPKSQNRLFLGLFSLRLAGMAGHISEPALMPFRRGPLRSLEPRLERRKNRTKQTSQKRRDSVPLSLPRPKRPP